MVGVEVTLPQSEERDVAEDERDAPVDLARQARQHDHAAQRSDDPQRCQRDEAEIRVPALRLVRNGGQARLQLGPHQHVDDVEARQHEARGERRREQVRNRDAGDQPVDDENDGGRDHRAQRAARATDADGERLVIAQTQHLRQRQQAEQHHLAADDTRHRSHHHRHEQRLHPERAAHATAHHPHGIEQVACDARPVEDRGHQHEHGHRDEHVGRDEGIDAAGDQRHRRRTEPAEREEQRHQQRDEGQRHTGDQQANQHGEHEGGGPFDAEALERPEDFELHGQRPLRLSVLTMWMMNCTAIATHDDEKQHLEECGIGRVKRRPGRFQLDRACAGGEPGPLDRGPGGVAEEENGDQPDGPR